MINKRDRDWTFPTQDFITHCISNIRHVLYLFKIEPDSCLQTLKGFGSLIFGVLIHYDDPDFAGPVGDAIRPVAIDGPAVVGRSLDIPLFYNSVQEINCGMV